MKCFGQVVVSGGPINHHWTTSPERLGGAFAAQTLWRLGSAPLYVKYGQWDPLRRLLDQNTSFLLQILVLVDHTCLWNAPGSSETMFKVWKYRGNIFSPQI